MAITQDLREIGFLREIGLAIKKSWNSIRNDVFDDMIIGEESELVCAFYMRFRPFLDKLGLLKKYKILVEYPLKDTKPTDSGRKKRYKPDIMVASVTKLIESRTKRKDRDNNKPWNPTIKSFVTMEFKWGIRNQISKKAIQESLERLEKYINKFGAKRSYLILLGRENIDTKQAKSLSQIVKETYKEMGISNTDKIFIAIGDYFSNDNKCWFVKKLDQIL